MKFLKSKYLKIGLLVLSVILITILGVGLRRYAAPRLSIDVDERVYLQAALQYAEYMRDGQWKMLAWYDYNTEHPPLYKIVYGAALAARSRLRLDTFDPQQFIDGMALYKVKDRRVGLTARWVSVALGGLTILVLSIVSPIAGLFFAVDTLAVQFNSSIFLESLPVLTSFLCVLCYLRWYGKADRKTPRPFWRVFWLGLSAGFLGITAASKYTYAVVGIAIVIHFTGSLLAKKNPARDLWKLAAWGVLALAFFYLFDPYLWKHPIANLLHSLTFHLEHTQSDVAQAAQLPFYQPLIWFSAPFYKWAGNANAIYPIKVDTLIGLLALVGLPRLFKRQPLYFIWLVVGMLVLMAWPNKLVQYAMMVMVPFCFAASMGASWLVDLLKKLWGNVEVLAA